MSGNVSDTADADSLAPLREGVDDLGIDVHHGSHDFPDLTAQVDDSEGIQQFGVRFEDAVKHMSVSKYESVASMIREYIANMAATCLDAKEELGDDYTPTIHVAYYPESETLIMEDNGMGMSDAEIENIGVQLGVSTNRYRKDRGGKYGIGMLSGLVGVGIDGAWYMHSRSRRTDEYVRGYWCSRGFKREDRLPDKLEDGQYGTRFEFPLQNAEVDVASAVAEIAQWTRVPVLYSERASDGSPIVDNEYGDRSDTPFCDLGAVDEGGAAVVETDAFRAVHAPGSDNRTVLLDVPIDRNFDAKAWRDMDDVDLRSKLPYYSDFDVVFRSEDEEIVAGPHAGKTRVGDGEYASMDEDKRDAYIPASECAPSDVWTPSPAGDRDRFEENPRFWTWLGEQLLDAFADELATHADAIREADRVIDAPQESLDFIATLMDESSGLSDEWAASALKARIDTYGVSLPGDDRKALAALSTNIDRCDRRSDNPYSRQSRTAVRLYEIVNELPDEADVWASARPSGKRAHVVWDDHPENVVVRASSDKIDILAGRYGWNDLSDITKRHLDEFDISEETAEMWETDRSYSNPNAGREAAERVLSLHYAALTDDNDRGFKDRTSKESARYLRAYFEAREQGYEPSRGRTNSIPSQAPIDLLVLFPSNTEESITDYVGSLAHGGVRLATCAVKTWEYLQDVERVTRIEEYLETAAERTFDTSAGECTIPEAREQAETVVVHLPPAEAHEHLTTERAMQRAAEWFEQESKTATNYDSTRPDLDDVVYVPATEESIMRVLPEFRHDDVRLATHETQFPLPQPKIIEDPGYDTELYVYARLPEWEDSAEYKMLVREKSRLKGGLQGVVDGLARLHDDGEPAPSEQATVPGDTYRDMLEVLD